MWNSKRIVQFIIITVFSSFCLTYFVFSGSSSDVADRFAPGSEMSSVTKLNVLLLGASGAVGTELVKALAEEDRVQRVTLFLRKEISLGDNIPNHTKFTQKIIDFDHLDGQDFNGGFDVCICSLGTTRGKSGVDGFRKVDHDYIVNTAKLAKSSGCKHYNLVSSAGANKNAWFLYPQVKGQVEEEVSNMQFLRTSIYRPGLLLAKRQEPRILEKCAQFVFHYVDCWRLASIETATVATAIVRNALHQSEKTVEVLSHKDILAMGK